MKRENLISNVSKPSPLPEELETLEALLKERMPERHLLDVLKNVHHEVKYTRHFGPPSGADPKLPEAVSRYSVDYLRLCL